MKRKIIFLSLILGLLVCLPVVTLFWGAEASPFAVVRLVIWLLCTVAITNLCIRNNQLIRDSYQILSTRIRNRLYGYKLPDIVYPLISPEQEMRLADAVKISFTGDLILLREMVERAYDSHSGGYDFDKMFEHVSDIWKNSDLAIGVFEGPLAGDNNSYSTSNYDDGVPLALNFPDSFAEAVKRAGINLVTLANNHIFDMGLDGGIRTAEVLDRIGLDYVGFDRDDTDADTPRIINVGGKRIGVLAYTFAVNGQKEDMFFGKTSQRHVKPVLSLGSKYFKRNQALIKRDFERMRREKPDMIIVLPHMGEQFLSAPDKSQRKWCDLFVSLGADIIFSDHPHHVQPIEWRRNDAGKTVLIVHCPGNFINCYTDFDGDASMIVSAYLDRKTLEPFAVGVTPVYAHCPQNGMWVGLPTYKAVTDRTISDSLSRADYRRINRVNRLVTGIALNSPLGVDTAQKEYISFVDTGLVRRIPAAMAEPFKPLMEKSALLAGINAVPSVCFVGDSVTDGTKNGGFGWYEPIVALFPGKNISRFALGLQTSRWVLDNADNIADKKAALYVVAIGCNDIRYREPAVCAMTAEDYVETLNKFVDKVKNRNPEADFVFIAPWRSLSFDALFKVKGHEKRRAIYRDYTERLRQFCETEGFMFLDPNPLIFDDINPANLRCRYGNGILKDFIHPDAYHGIMTYCKAVAKCVCNN